jgi:hypothetical protein
VAQKGIPGLARCIEVTLFQEQHQHISAGVQKSSRRPICKH